MSESLLAALPDALAALCLLAVPVCAVVAVIRYAQGYRPGWWVPDCVALGFAAPFAGLLLLQRRDGSDGIEFWSCAIALGWLMAVMAGARLRPYRMALGFWWIGFPYREALRASKKAVKTVEERVKRRKVSPR